MPDKLQDYLTNNDKLNINAATGIADYNMYMCDYECSLRIRQVLETQADRVVVKAMVDTIADELGLD